MRLLSTQIPLIFSALFFLPSLALAEEATHKPLDLTASGVGIAAIMIFLVAYSGFWSH